MERFIQCYEAAQELGAKKIVYHTCYHPGIYFLIGWAERMEEFFHEFLADRKDISIVLENVFDREWEPILEVKQRLPEPNFSLCLDIGHAHCMSPHPVEEWAQKLAGEITHLHVHDNHGERDEHLGLGKGTIPVREVLKNFQGREDCTYTIECNTKRRCTDVLQDAAGDSVNKCKGFADRRKREKSPVVSKAFFVCAGEG